MSDEFDYEEELHKYPADFGGLKVSFIRESLYPTADRARPGGSSITITNYGYQDILTSLLANNGTESFWFRGFFWEYITSFCF